MQWGGHRGSAQTNRVEHATVTGTVGGSRVGAPGNRDRSVGASRGRPAAGRVTRGSWRRLPVGRGAPLAGREQLLLVHNNGDTARVLYTAIRLDYTVEPEALRDTTAWLQNPAAWDNNALGLKFADTKLAQIQFAGALVDAMLVSEISDPVPLAQAAALIAADESDGGSWPLDTSGSIGSPTTYGTALATWAALRVLTRAGVPNLTAVITRANAWARGLSRRRPSSTRQR